MFLKKVSILIFGEAQFLNEIFCFTAESIIKTCHPKIYYSGFEITKTEDLEICYFLLLLGVIQNVYFSSNYLIEIFIIIFCVDLSTKNNIFKMLKNSKDENHLFAQFC